MGGSSVKTTGLVREYRMGDGIVRALDGLDVAIRPGESVAVMGPSGSGKSTLLHMLGALDRPTAGEVWVDDVELSHSSERDQIRHRRERVGFVFQGFHLLSTRTSLENVELPLMLAGLPPADRRERAHLLLEQVGLSHRLNHRPGQLSAGEQQRVAIARALANHPSLLLADEPTGNLDSRTGGEVMALLRKLQEEEGSTLVVVTHDPQVAAWAGRVLRLHDGRLATEENTA